MIPTPQYMLWFRALKYEFGGNKIQFIIGVVSHLTCCALWTSRKLAESEDPLEKTEDKGDKEYQLLSEENYSNKGSYH